MGRATSTRPIHDYNGFYNGIHRGNIGVILEYNGLYNGIYRGNIGVILG